MKFNAAALKLMLDKGLTLGDVVEIAAANERVSDPGAAERMRNMRARKRVTRNVTPEPPNDNILTPVSEAKASSTLEPRRNGKHRLPVDWQPKPFTAGTHAEQIVQRWEPGRLERELSKFRDHHTAAGTMWVDWQAAWSKWVNNSRDFERPQNVGTIGKTAATFALLQGGRDEPF